MEHTRIVTPSELENFADAKRTCLIDVPSTPIATTRAILPIFSLSLFSLFNS